ncbi:MAG: sigma-70 family RNA polymerase sigma factor [Myxococcota bacterium]
MFGWFKKTTQSDFEAQTLPYIDALYHSALRLCRNESDAEDLVQDTMLKAFRFFHQYTQGTHVKAWLFKIMTNTFINHYRKRQKSPELLDDWDWDQLTPPFSEDFERNFFQNTFHKTVLQAIEELPVDFRMVLVLSDIEEFAYKEIADMVDCPIGTVMSRLYRGRRILRKKLHQYAIEQGLVDDPLPVVDIDNVTHIEHYRRQQQDRALEASQA